jgi:hypothetical protein
MLISEIKGTPYYISWDNPVPADSSEMLRALKKLGRVTKLHLKTTVALFPRSSITFRQVRNAIKANFNPQIGNAMYINMFTGKGFQIGKKTKRLWKHAA